VTISPVRWSTVTITTTTFLGQLAAVRRTPWPMSPTIPST
jgi:hypothetical protein